MAIITQTLAQRRPKPKRTVQERFISKIQPDLETGCWLWVGAKVGSTGYGQCADAVGKPRAAHRVSWELFRGEIPKNAFVKHVDTNQCPKNCVNPKHLYVDKARKKPKNNETKPYPSSVLSKQQVEEIRERYKPRSERTRIKDLAAEFNVSIVTVRNILTGKSNGGKKLTKSDVLKIREKYEPEEKNAASRLAQEYGVSLNTILSVASGRSWKDNNEAA